MLAIYRKEMKIYFSGVFGYFIAALLLLFGGLFTVIFHLITRYTQFAYTLVSMKWVLIVAIPFLSMRAIAEERHNRTDQLLYSLPIPLWEVVMGKFFALATVFFIPTAVMAVYPLLLSALGPISLPSAYGALLAYFLMGASLIALCMFISSLVENQIVAAVLCIGGLLVLYFLNFFVALLPTSPIVSFLLCLLGSLGVGAVLWRISKSLAVGLLTAAVLCGATAAVYFLNTALFASLIQRFLTAASPFVRFDGFANGRLDLPALIFYLTFIGFFLFLTVRSMEKRRLV